jgi:hypothetical protein
LQNLNKINHKSLVCQGNGMRRENRFLFLLSFQRCTAENKERDRMDIYAATAFEITNFSTRGWILNHSLI